MDVYIFNSTIIVKSKTLTEQIGKNDYRFDLIKSTNDKLERVDIIEHKCLTKYNKKLVFKDGKICYGDIAIPNEILTASFINYGDQSRFGAYVNGWITNLNTKKYCKIETMYPFFDDGTLFTDNKCDLESIINEYWPSITSGVRKKLSNIYRERFDNRLIIVSLFGFNPNDEIRALELINSTNIDCCDLKTISSLRDSKTLKLFNIKNFNNFSKLIKEDNSWFDHICQIHKTLTDVWDHDNDRKIQMFYPLNLMVAYCNKIKSSISKYRVYFNKYTYMYEFFDGLDIGDGLTIRIPKSNSDLAEWGYELHNCVGSQGYINECYEASGKKLLYMVEKNKKPYVLAYVEPEKPVQIHTDNNKCLESTDKELHDKIFKIGSSILKCETDHLSKYVTQLHMFNKLEQYKKSGKICNSWVTRAATKNMLDSMFENNKTSEQVVMNV